LNGSYCIDYPGSVKMAVSGFHACFDPVRPQKPGS
jgi:hypothetical protein